MKGIRGEVQQAALNLESVQSIISDNQTKIGVEATVNGQQQRALDSLREELMGDKDSGTPSVRLRLSEHHKDLQEMSRIVEELSKDIYGDKDRGRDGISGQVTSLSTLYKQGQGAWRVIGGLVSITLALVGFFWQNSIQANFTSQGRSIGRLESNVETQRIKSAEQSVRIDRNEAEIDRMRGQ
jgi:hypothetical protein